MKITHTIDTAAPEAPKVRAPASESRPATIQTSMSIPGVPTLQIITRDLTKMPVPMMFAR